MTPPSPDEELEAIDARSHELIREFLEHKEQINSLRPDADDSRVFEGWAIQKLAGLQHSVLRLAMQLEELQKRLKP